MKYIESNYFEKNRFKEWPKSLKSSMLPLSCFVYNQFYNFIALNSFLHTIYTFVLTYTINKIIVQLTRKVLYYKFYLPVKKIKRQKKRDI